MEHLPYKNLAGILVGNIMPNSKTLVIAIYAEPTGEHPLRIAYAKDSGTPYDAAKTLIKTFYPAVRSAWQNDSAPKWYYLQFSIVHPPRELYGWALPIQAYGLWMDALAEAQGLVGYAISPHDADKPVPATFGPAPWLGQGKADDD